MCYKALVKIIIATLQLSGSLVYLLFKKILRYNSRFNFKNLIIWDAN